MPILLPRMTASSSSLRPMKSRPATRTEPDVARSRPATIINSDVLPDPLGPTTATDSPAPISTLTRLKISTGPARLESVSETSLRAMTGSATLANMVFAFVLCNWLTAALTLGWDRAHAGQPLRIVVFGDSLVAGLGLKPSDAFPAQLERALKARGYSVEVINAGVSGDTTAGGLARAT